MNGKMNKIIKAQPLESEGLSLELQMRDGVKGVSAWKQEGQANIFPLRCHLDAKTLHTAIVSIEQ